MLLLSNPVLHCAHLSTKMSAHHFKERTNLVVVDVMQLLQSNRQLQINTAYPKDEECMGID